MLSAIRLPYRLPLCSHSPHNAHHSTSIHVSAPCFSVCVMMCVLCSGGLHCEGEEGAGSEADGAVDCTPLHVAQENGSAASGTLLY